MFLQDIRVESKRVKRCSTPLVTGALHIIPQDTSHQNGHDWRDCKPPALPVEMEKDAAAWQVRQFLKQFYAYVYNQEMKTCALKNSVIICLQRRYS